MHAIALHVISFHAIAFNAIAFNAIALHVIVLYVIAFHCMSFHCMSLHCMSLHCIPCHSFFVMAWTGNFFFSMCQGLASEVSHSLTIVSLFSGKYPHTGRWWYMYRHRYAYHTLSSTALENPSSTISQIEQNLWFYLIYKALEQSITGGVFKIFEN